MPSVGMRLTTRVFGVVKGADGDRVLRSGRRMWPDSCDGKGARRDRDEWLRVLGNRGNGDGGGACKKSGWVKSAQSDAKMDAPEVPVPAAASAQERPAEKGPVDKMWGLVYTRKRKRLAPKSVQLSDSKLVPSVKRYGIHFTRRQRRRKNDDETHKGDDNKLAVLEASLPGPLLALLPESSSTANVFASLLNHLLQYMKRARVRLPDLSAFLATDPISFVYSSHGIRFTKDPPASRTSLTCKIYQPRQFTPMFTVDFSALPQCFMHMHKSMSLRNNLRNYALLNNSMAVDTSDDMSVDQERREISLDSFETDNVVNRNTGLYLPDFLRSSKLGCQTPQHKIGINFRSIQKRRSSIRSRRGRYPSLNGSGMNGSKKNGAPFTSMRRSVWGGNVKDRSSTMVTIPQELETSCSANILIVESDKCYREEGAMVMLEMSSSGEWCLVVKKDETMRYSHKAQNVMRSWTCNRFTHAIVWSGDNDWKLEFPKRQDWLVFKDLYKECSDRNVTLSPTFKIIPVPEVSEVSDYGDSNGAAFHRPDSYIRLDANEVERALAKKTANYDMDSEDEEWLNNFNNEVVAGDAIVEHVSEGNFELMVDAFEKALFRSPDECSDENAAINLCLDLGRREAVEAVYNYWVKKRKLKRSVLLKVFQVHQQKRASLNTKSVRRKKRSSKRYPNKYGRGKQPSVLRAIAAEQAAVERQKAEHRVEEAKATVEKRREIAVGKRKRAQSLMENADLATYKATMAVRIAEAAQSTGSTDVSCTNILD